MNIQIINVDVCLSRTKILYHWTYIFMTQALGHAVFPTFVQFYPVLCGSSLIYGVSFGLIVSQSVPVVVQALPQRLNSIGIAMEFTVYGLSTVLGGFVCGQHFLNYHETATDIN